MLLTLFHMLLSFGHLLRHGRYDSVVIPRHIFAGAFVKEAVPKISFVYVGLLCQVKYCMCQMDW